MSTILFAWEMGTGLGHISRIQPIAAGLVACGHRVIVAARDVGLSYEILRHVATPVLQAPLESDLRARTPTAETYSHVLFNCGFAEAHQLEARVAAWLQLFDFIQPDFVVVDSGPTALLAAHCANIRRIALGTGFECPPDVSPMPPLRRQTQCVTMPSDYIEQAVLANIHATCDHFGATALTQVSKLYHGQHPPLLLTYRELDCYAPRDATHYWGAITFSNGRPPVWPKGNGPRVFAYMLEHEFTPVVIRLLAELAWPTLVVGGRQSIVNSNIAIPSTIRIASERFDSQLIASNCDFTVCYAGHGTICMNLLAGKPLLVMPITVEQFLNSLAVSEIGAGELGQVGSAGQVRGALERLAVNCSFRQAAKRFSTQNSISAAQPIAHQIVAYLQALLAS